MTIGREDVARAYARTAQSTVDVGPTLLVRLYDRLAHDLALAKEFIEAKDPLGANDALQHAQKIVHVLRTSLNPDGFEGGHTLMRLYNTVIEQLVKANLSKDIPTIERCQQIVAPLHAAWAEAVAREMERSGTGAHAVGVG